MKPFGKKGKAVDSVDVPKARAGVDIDTNQVKAKFGYSNRKFRELSEESATTEVYLGYTRKKVLFIIGCAVILFVLSIFTIRLGDTGLNYWDILKYIFSPDGSWNSVVVWDLRMPRIIAAIAAGCALGVAGAVMQGILRNPLASPFTLGISNAAAFGAAIGILFFEAGKVGGNLNLIVNISNPLVVTLFAFIFAMVATFIVIALVKLTECTPETIVLAGLAISSIFSAGLAFIQYIANDTALAAIVFWQFGSLSKITWSNLYIVIAVTVVISLYFFYKRWDYNAMEAGEDVAKGLGVNVSKTRIVGMTASAVLTATVVSFMGIIGFIGLVGPHIVKRLIGNDNRYVIPCSMLMGAVVLLLAHIVGTYAFKVSIPVGIITSAIGGPLFILILLRGRKK